MTDDKGKLRVQMLSLQGNADLTLCDPVILAFDIMIPRTQVPASIRTTRAKQGRSEEFDLGVYVLTSHCNFKTYVNVPHVNINHIECPGSQEKNNHVNFFKVD